MLWHMVPRGQILITLAITWLFVLHHHEVDICGLGNCWIVGIFGTDTCSPEEELYYFGSWCAKQMWFPSASSLALSSKLLVLFLLHICIFQIMPPLSLVLCFSTSYHVLNAFIFAPSFIVRMVNNSRMDTSTTSALEASASSSTGSSALMDTGLDLSSNRKEEGNPADLSLSQNQYVEDKEMLDTKKDQQFGWTDCGLLGYCARNW